MPDAFDGDGLEQARRLLEEIERDLPTVQGIDGPVVTDRQTQKILRVLRILADQVEELRRDE